MAQVKLESATLGSGGKLLTQKRESLFQYAFRRLIRNRAAVIGGAIIILLISMASMGVACRKKVMKPSSLRIWS